MNYDSLGRILTNAATIAVKYAKGHPYLTAFTVSVGLMPILRPEWLPAPLVRLIGFGPRGPIARRRKLRC